MSYWSYSCCVLECLEDFLKFINRTNKSNDCNEQCNRCAFLLLKIQFILRFSCEIIINSSRKYVF